MQTARSLLFFLLILGLDSCSRDPKGYVSRGNKFFERGRYKEAAIMYRNAIKVDQKYGEAYFRLAAAEIKLSHTPDAVGALRRSIELLPRDTPDWMNANYQYADILLSAVPNLRPAEQTATLDEIRTIQSAVLKTAPRSFETQKLSASLLLDEAIVSGQKFKTDEKRQKLEEALVAYQGALAAKPGDTKTMLAIAKIDMLSGRTGDGEAMYRQVIAKDKTLASPYQDLFNLYKSRQQNPQAEEILRQSIAAHPNDASLQYQLAGFYFAEKKTREMADLLTKLKAQSKTDPETFLKIGDFYAQIGDQDAAIKTYKEGMASDHGRRLEYQKRIIVALLRKGKKDEALQNVEEVLKANPKDLQAHDMKASFLLSQGQVDAAIGELQTVVSGDPNNVTARTNLGHAYTEKKDLSQASHQFEAALAVNPEYLPARTALAQIALLRHNPDLALSLAQGTLKINPTHGASMLLEGTAYVHKGEYDKARSILEPMIKANPTRADPMAELAIVDVLQKRYKEAEDLFRKAYEAEPTNLRGLMGIEQVRAETKDFDGLVRVVQEEVRKQPERVDLKRELANAEMRASRFDKAITDYQAVVDHYKSNPVEQAEIYGRIGQSCDLKGDVQCGIDNYRKARQISPSNTFYIRRIGELQERAGRSAEALASYREAWKLDPDDPVVMTRLASLMSDMGQNLDEALTLAQRARQRSPNLHDASDAIGFIYLKKGLSENAIEVFRDLTSKEEDNSTYHYHYGLALAQKGDRVGALRECKAALKYNPSRTEEAGIKDLLNKVS